LAAAKEPEEEEKANHAEEIDLPVREKLIHEELIEVTKM
jgi:hypothetical protein